MQWLRTLADHPLELLDACYERLAKIGDNRFEEDRHWREAAALNVARVLERRKLTEA